MVTVMTRSQDVSLSFTQQVLFYLYIVLLTLRYGKCKRDSTYMTCSSSSHHHYHHYMHMHIQRDLVDPAVKGTKDVLESVNKAGTVRTVILTSSVAGK